MPIRAREHFFELLPQCLTKGVLNFCRFKAVVKKATTRSATYMDWRQVFATNIRRLRHARGLSQESLALEAQMNRTYVSKLEAGKTWAGLEIMVKLAAVFDVEPAELLKRQTKRRRRSA